MPIFKEHELIQRALNDNPFVDVCSSDGDIMTKEIYIDNRNFSNSTLEIWQSKGMYCASMKQYIKYKRKVLEFQLAFTCFINTNADFYHYTFKCCE